MFPDRISFVVIAKNEGRTISQCIHSIINCAQILSDYEIIFIDSLSGDDTLDKVIGIRLNGQEDKIQISQITKNPNQARARNIGANFAKFEYIFFVDGDCVLCPEFIKVALNEMKNCNEIGCVLGQLEEIQYSQDYKKVIRIVKDIRNIKKRSIWGKISGGIFLTKKSIFQELEGFDERFDINEDRDFLLRLGRKYEIIGCPKKMGVHHTIPYRNRGRAITNIGNRQQLLVGVLIRRYVLHLCDISYIIKLDYGLILGGLFWPLLFLSIFTPYVFVKLLFIVFIFVDIVLGLKKEPENIIGRFISHYVFSIYTLLGFLFCFPRRKKVEWKKIC